MYGESLLASPLDTIREKSGKTTFDRIEIRSTAIHIRRLRASLSVYKLHVFVNVYVSFRSSSHVRSSGQESVDSLTILEPMHFTATITRNLGNPMLALPNIDVKLPLNIVKVRTYMYVYTYHFAHVHSVCTVEGMITVSTTYMSFR